MNNEILNNEENQENEALIVSVIDEDGVEHIFEELDSFEMDDNEFVALLPIYDEEVADEDGELIILMRNYDGDEIYLEPIEDENLFMKVGRMFEDRLSDIFEFDEE